MPSALIVSVDGLHSGFLGPYGNTWVQTPHLDALAAAGFVFDQALVAHPALARVFDALWTVSRPGVDAPGTLGEPVWLPQVLAEAGIVTVLATDEPALLEHQSAEGFVRRVLLPAEDLRKPAREIAETGLAQACLAAADCLRELPAPFLLWIHLRGMTAPWDAPSALREQYADPDDPPTPRFVAVPDVQLPADPDPDEVLGIVHAYSGQVSLLDTCLAVLREALAEHPAASSTLFSLIGARSFPLGEHGRIGGRAAPLYSELLQIPWLLELPGGIGALDRSAALVQQQDLAATLLAWWQLAGAVPAAGSRDLLPLVADEPVPTRDRVLLATDAGEQLLRTPAWLLRASGSGTPRRLELFAKPSDRWDVNEVADRAPQITEALSTALSESLSAPRGQQLPPLAAELIEPMD